MTITDPFDCHFYLITRASLLVTSTLRRELASAGVEQIRPAYLGVLLVLWGGDGVRSVDLAHRAGLEPSTMTGLLDRMARDGLVRREADPDDRRAQRIFLTDHGREVEGPVNEVVDSTVERVLGNVPDKDLRQLKTTLRQMLANANTRDP
ncbi:MAG: MarR family winged helix-turn-helix transcriptional regulator [bacterium]